MSRNYNTASGRNGSANAGNTYVGSMKAVGHGQSAASVNRNYGSTKTLYSSSASRRNDEDEEEQKNSGNSSGSAGRNSSSNNERRNTNYGKAMYNSSWSARPEEKKEYTLENLFPQKEPEDRVNVGQLAYGVFDQAANQVIGDALGAVDMFIGNPLQKIMDYGEEKFGWEDRGENFISAYNDQFQEKARREAEYYAQNASKSELASLVNQFGPTVLALLPDLALAYFSGGTSLAARGTMAAAKTADIVSDAAKLDDFYDLLKIAKNGSLWSGAARTSGQSYNQALAEGAEENEAFKYAMANGLLDLGLNAFGLMRGQAGMETLPGQLRELATPEQYLRAYGKAAVHDGFEGVAQGAAQRGARAIYDDNVKLLSEDVTGVINPTGIFADFAGGAAASLVASGMHAGTKILDKPANAAAARLERAYFADEMSKGESPIDYADALRSAELMGRLTKGEMLSDKDIKELNINNKTVREIFTRETGVPLSSFDIKNDSILRQKLNITAAKTKHGDTIDRYPLERLGYTMYTNVTGKPRSHNYKHGDWTKNVILEDSTHFKREGRYKRLRPNVSYVGGDQTPYIYQTDHLARPKNVTGVLILAPEKMSEYRYGNTPEKIKGYDDAGHIVGRRFQGSGKLDNLLSQCAEVNRGEYKKLEDSWEAALRDGKELYVDFDIGYSGNSKRPEYYDITYYIDGKYNTTRIYNPKKQ